MIFKVALLTIIWVILREELTFFNLIAGIVISMGCVAYSRKFLPLKGIRNINWLKIIFYVFYLVGQIYIAGFHVIKLIIKGHVRWEILQTTTLIEHKTLRILLGDSVTLTPGSVMLDLRDDIMTVLVLAEEDEVIKPEEVNNTILGGLEDKLMQCLL